MLILALLLFYSAEAKQPTAERNFSELRTKLHRTLAPTIGVNEVLQIAISSLLISIKLGIDASTTGQDEPIFLAILSFSLTAISIIIGGSIGMFNGGIAGWAIGVFTAIIGTKGGMIANAIRRGHHIPYTQNILLGGVLAGIWLSATSIIFFIPAIALFLHSKKASRHSAKRKKQRAHAMDGALSESCTRETPKKH